MAVKKVLILGGYGNFGKRITECLSVIRGITLVVAGRQVHRARKLCQELNTKGALAVLEPIALDICSHNFVNDLMALSPELVIHTGGPFQGQSYRVPEACIAIGSHYIDLADDRRFVCDIGSLNERALAKNVLVVSGASSVPGLSSVIVDNFLNQFSKLDAIDIAIAPGNKAERGEATVRGVLSYTGHPFPVFVNNKWIARYGWMSPRKLDFGATIGKRWLANVDIPDLEIFPERYQPVRSVNFQAGLELPALHIGMVFMALMAKFGLIKDWSVFSRKIYKASDMLKGLGTDIGGMQVNLSGLDTNGDSRHVRWTLCAENGVGPYIPTISAIILAKKMIAGNQVNAGAMPCLGMYSLEEFDKEASPLKIFHQTEYGDG